MAVALRLEKGPAALRRCRIIFVWGPNSPLAALILWRETTKFVIARRPKADVAILQYPAESWESDRQKRSCLPEIATAPLGPRNDKLGSIARSTMPSYHLPACKARRERRCGHRWGSSPVLTAPLFHIRGEELPRAVVFRVEEQLVRRAGLCHDTALQKNDLI